MADEENDNLRIWNKLGKTDPKHTKPFKRAGGFAGTAVKPIYTERKMTEEFGPAGQGWGIGEPHFQIVSGFNSEVMVYCTVALWWGSNIGDDGRHLNCVYGVGGDKVVSYVKANEQYKRPERWENDDEAFKKAFTDAVGNAMKHLGMSADVHMGLFDDSKYVSERTREEEETANASQDGLGASPRLPKAQARELYSRLQTALGERDSALGIEAWWSHDKVQAAVRTLPLDWEEMLGASMSEKYSAAVAAESGAPVKAPMDSLDELERGK